MRRIPLTLVSTEGQMAIQSVVCNVIRPRHLLVVPALRIRSNCSHPADTARPDSDGLHSACVVLVHHCSVWLPDHLACVRPDSHDHHILNI
jgi:hypothetical protein